MLCARVWAIPPGSQEPLFEASFPASVHPQPITGRLFLLISRINDPEVRLQSHWYNSPEILGIDVSQLSPGKSVFIDGSILGTPLPSLVDIPPGDYYVQAVLSIYTEFYRADGHTVWAHNDQWEGQNFARSAGNLLSPVRQVHLDPTEYT